ncbi:hypothetical protein TNCV_3644891 [Trichonephila clavipes]|nr:hypothetical protein TNCV_3644891 [Trichonephila clavipes]
MTTTKYFVSGNVTGVTKISYEVYVIGNHMKPFTDTEIMKECFLNASNSVDEAHFWLNGYVNKQNCRIWSEANPQVYVETPLHPEKLTVWCALWAGGLLLQKR